MESNLTEDEMSRFIQLCLSDDDVPESELQTLEDIMKTEGARAKEVALRLMDERMIRSWFRSEADTCFISEVQKRLNIRFKDREFIEAVMSKVEEGIITSSVGDAGKEVVKQEIKSVSILKYIFVPFLAAVIYVGVFRTDFIKAFFIDAESFMMTVQDMDGQPAIISGEKRKTVILKMLIKPGDTLNTGSQETMTLRYPDHTSVEVLANSNLILVKSTASKEILFLQGSIKLNVLLQAEGSPFTVQTRYGSVRINTGVVNIFLRDGKDFIEVLGGSVVVEQAGGENSKKVLAGQNVTVSEQDILVMKRELKRNREK
jgi:hypothetical protein